jgi:hypothetical protein
VADHFFQNHSYSPTFGKLSRLVLVFCTLLAVNIFVRAQSTTPSALMPGEPETHTVEGVTETDVFGMGRSIIVRGTVKRGAMAFGGDVIVEGTVEGDVAAIGGSVRQMPGSRIGGDVLVIGGGYYRDKNAVERDPASTTVMIAGYEQELRNIMRDPSSLLAAQWSLKYLGQRVLSILFWFIVSLALTAASPGAVSRAVARLQLTNIRVAAIGLVSSIVIFIGVPMALKFLPTPLSVLVMVTAVLLILVAFLFGRVAIHAATGRWLQRVLMSEGQRSESVALLIGSVFWTTVLSLPYVWPLVVGGLMVTSLGLALTARYRVAWKREQPVRGKKTGGNRENG